MGITICEMDLTKLILKQYKPNVITDLGPHKVKITLETKEIIEVVEDDPMLQQEFVDAGREALEKVAKALSAELKLFDVDAEKCLKKTGLRTDALAFAQGFEKAYQDGVDEAENMARVSIEKVWKDYTKTRRDFNKYKVKIGAKAVLGLVGLGAAVAGAIGAATTGALPAVVLSCIGAAKSLSTTLQTVATAVKSAATVYGELRSSILELQDRYNGMSKTSATAKEIFLKSVDKFTTVGLNSIKKCESDLDTFKNKLNGVKIHANKASVDLNKLLAETEKIDDLLKKVGVEKLVAKYKNDLAQAEKNIDDTIGKVQDLVAEINNGKAATVQIAADIKKLKERIDTRVYTGAAIVLDMAGLGADLFGGNTVYKEFEEASNVVGNVASSLAGVKEGIEDYFKREK